MKNTTRIFILLLGDVLMFTTSFFLMLAVAFPGVINENLIKIHTFPFIIIALLWLLILFIFGLYETKNIRTTTTNMWRIGIASITAISASALLFYAFPIFGITPRTNLVIFGAIFITIFLIWRKLFYNFFSTYFKKTIIFIANKDSDKQYISDLTEHISMNPHSGFVVVDQYLTLDEFFKQNKHNPNIFIISKDALKDTENFKKLYNTNSEIIDLIYAYEDILKRIPVESVDDGWFLHNIRSSSKEIYEKIKRGLSVSIALIALLVFSPILILVAIIMKFYDRGPIIYKQTRVGEKGKIFTIYKIRSMVIDAEKNGAEWAKKNDTRVTPLGKILRKLHIDEIPQLWNVVRGDIALVGPRPERPEFVAQLEREIPYYYLRHTITPGFTGWAQIKFRYARSVMDSKDKFEYDLYYIKNRSLFMDIGIIIRTIQIIFSH